MKRMTVAVLVFVVVLAGSIVLRGGGSPAQAYAHIGCKWHTNQLGDLRFSSPNKYKTAVREAFGAWNTEAAWFGVKFKEVTSNFDIVHQSLNSGPDGYFGSTYSNCVDGYFPTAG